MDQSLPEKLPAQAAVDALVAVELSRAQLMMVTGGLNPQPLPPHVEEGFLR